MTQAEIIIASFGPVFKLDSKRDFVRFLSHEIRTPLSTASMGLELMAEMTNEEKDEEDGNN